MNKYLFYIIAYAIQSSIVLAMEKPSTDNPTVSLSRSGSSSNISSSASSDIDMVGLESDEEMPQTLSAKQRMEKYLKTWDNGPSSAIPSHLFDEVFSSKDVSSLEKVGLALFQHRLTPSHTLSCHQIAHYLGREFTDFYQIPYGEVVFFSGIGALLGVVPGFLGGISIWVCSGSPAIGFGIGIPLAFTIGGSIGGGLSYGNAARKWDISSSPIPISNTSIEWISVNINEHYRLYQQKVTDALYTDFKSLDSHAFSILKTSLLDINGALPVTKITQGLPEEKKFSAFIFPQDICKFKITTEEESFLVELYAYGPQSIQNTANLVTYLQDKSSSVIRSVYNILVSLADHKNFYAYTDSQNQTFNYSTPTMIEKEQ